MSVSLRRCLKRPPFVLHQPLIGLPRKLSTNFNGFGMRHRSPGALQTGHQLRQKQLSYVLPIKDQPVVSLKVTIRRKDRAATPNGDPDSDK